MIANEPVQAMAGSAMPGPQIAVDHGTGLTTHGQQGAVAIPAWLMGVVAAIGTFDLLAEYAGYCGKVQLVKPAQIAQPAPKGGWTGDRIPFEQGFQGGIVESCGIG